MLATAILTSTIRPEPMARYFFT